MDPSLHSGQGHSLAVCRILAAWFAEDPSCTITFIQVPSKLEWAIHKEAHNYAKALILPAGLWPATSLDSVQKAVTKCSQDSWTRMFEDPSYKGHNFLHLEHLNGDTLKPTYINGGVWLSPVGGNLLVAVRLLDAFSPMLQLDCTMNSSILTNPSFAIVAFIARIVIMSSLHATSIKGNPTRILIILRTPSTSWKIILRCSLSDGLLGSVNQLPSVWASMNLCHERCSIAEAERAGTLWGVPMRPSSGLWVCSQLGRASQHLGVVSTLTPVLPSVRTRGQEGSCPGFYLMRLVSFSVLKYLDHS